MCGCTTAIKCTGLVEQLDGAAIGGTTACDKIASKQCTLSKQIDFVDGRLSCLLQEFMQMEMDINDIGKRLDSCESLMSPKLR